MPISEKRAQAVADAAVAWAKKVNKASVRAKDRDRALMLAKRGYGASEYLARVMVSDMAREVLRAVARAHRTGEIPGRWANPEEANKLSSRGLSKYDPRVAFQTAFRTAQAAGEFEYATETENVSHLEYVTARDSHVRETHRKRDRTILPKGHRWWLTNTPPLDPRCRCRIRGVTKAEVTKRRQRGQEVDGQPPELRQVRHKNKATGEVITTAEGVAPGFGLSPAGIDNVDRYRQLLERHFASMLAEAERP